MKKFLCPFCKEKEVPTTRSEDNAEIWPFCSEKCKLRDLGKWTSGEYYVAGEKASVTEDEESSDNY